MKWINIVLLMACLAVIAGAAFPKFVPRIKGLTSDAVVAGADAQSRWSDVLTLFRGPSEVATAQLKRDPMRISGGATAPHLTADDRLAAAERWCEMLEQARAATPPAVVSNEGARKATERAKAASAAARQRRTAKTQTTDSEHRSVFERSSHYKKKGSTYERRNRFGRHGRNVRRVRR